MRIISGTRRGMHLVALKGNNTRPTSDKVKEALFSMIQFKISDAVCLDLFAGSGALGIEAISRGAKFAYFVDDNALAVNIIRQNLEKAKFSSNAKVMRADAKKALTLLPNAGIDLLFLDPPYSQKMIPNIMSLILEINLLKTSATIVCEQNGDEEIASAYGNFKLYKHKRYSDTVISIYTNEEIQ